MLWCSANLATIAMQFLKIFPPLNLQWALLVQYQSIQTILVQFLFISFITGTRAPTFDETGYALLLSHHYLAINITRIKGEKNLR